MEQAQAASIGFNVIDAHESQVRYYCRQFPAVFSRASGSTLWDSNGRQYVDFFAGAGALNYGHNPKQIRARLVEYLMEDGISHGLDMATLAKARFVKQFYDLILRPRQMTHRVMFTGPTGANAVEAALKLARKAAGRSTVLSFTNAFHGMSLGALATTGNRSKRDGAGMLLSGIDRMPYDGYFGRDIDTLDYVEKLLDDPGSGIDKPAAVIVETVQAEGGVNVARDSWLKRLQLLCSEREILLIVDDIQAGCGRTGPFFSFESAGLDPDIVCLSKSLSGYGLPLAMLLVKPVHDCLAPGQHNGTFRGNNLAFVTATEALSFWRNGDFTKMVMDRSRLLRSGLEALIADHAKLDGSLRGKGMILGVDIPAPGLAERIAATAFDLGLVLETAGSRSQVLKVMPPLVIAADELQHGLDILAAAVTAELRQTAPPSRATRTRLH